jgi:hypothetical protein
VRKEKEHSCGWKFKIRLGLTTLTHPLLVLSLSEHRDVATV